MIGAATGQPVVVNGHPMQPPMQQYVVLNPALAQPANTNPTVRSKVEYSAKNLSTVKWLTIAQLMLACAILIFHCVTTALNDHFSATLAGMSRFTKYDIFNYYTNFVDSDATGIWVGVLAIIAAVIGIQGYKKQRKGLIITHLIFNVLLLLCHCAVIATVSLTIQELNYCRHSGHWYYYPSYNSYNYYSNSYYGTTTTTTTPKPFLFFGEQLTGFRGNYYCTGVIFKAWLAFDCVVLVCAIVSFFVTFALLMYNSTAACRRCCAGGCCRCCTNPTTNDGMMVAYYAQPAGQPMMANTAVVGQPSFFGQHGAVPMYAHPGTPVMMTANNQYASAMQPGAGGVPVAPLTTPTPAAMTQAAPAGAASNQDEKWEDLPPEYA